MNIQKRMVIQVPLGQKKVRLDKYLAMHVQNSSRTKIQHAIENGWVLVNDKVIKSNYTVLPSDRINIEIPDRPEKPDIIPENIPLEIVFEDNHLLVVNKPAGIVTHPAYKNDSGTLVNALIYYLQNSGEENSEGGVPPLVRGGAASGLSNLYGIERAGIVHRLDKNTSGLLVVAKNEDVHRKLSALFSKHDIEREYWALVWGRFYKKSGVIEKSLGRSHMDRRKVVVTEQGKHAVTHYEVIKEYEFLTLVKLNLMTGRTHQIRVHLHSIGHPVFGDPDYEGRKAHGIALTNKLKEEIKLLLDLMPRQALHAKILGFTHPVTGEQMHFDSPLPEDIQNLIDHL